MLIDEIVKYCGDKYRTHMQNGCDNCSYEIYCPKRCDICLHYIHTPTAAPAPRKYDCPYMAYYYVCKYSYKYMSELVYAFAQLRNLQNKKHLKVMSIGCGPSTDLFALDFLREDGVYRFDTIEFRGIDLAQNVWFDIHNQIKKYASGQYGVKFYYKDVTEFIDVIADVKWAPDLIVFQYVFSDISQHDTKQSEFNMMKQVASLGVPMCRPIEFGTCEEGVYSIQSWIDGEDTEEVISGYSDTEQYVYGLEAGRILRKIHSIPAPAAQEDWEIRFNRKMDYKIRKYGECPIKYENGQAFIDYINRNRHLLKDRPQVYQHGDYHIGNMMIDRGGKLHIIDFNRNDFGDPWEEFNRIVWCAQKTPLFASGMVNGYFDDNVPMDFWRLLALYISSNTLSSVYWAIPFGQDEVNTMLNQAREVLSWYDNMQNPVPTWYKGVTVNE